MSVLTDDDEYVPTIEAMRQTLTFCEQKLMHCFQSHEKKKRVKSQIMGLQNREVMVLRYRET